jgi:hypothetical protein
MAESASLARLEPLVSVIETYAAARPGRLLPDFSTVLQFSSPAEHLSFLGLLTALSFGSGWRPELLRQAGAGDDPSSAEPDQLMKFGSISLFLALSGDLSTESLRQVQLSDLADAFRLPLTVDTPLSPDFPGVATVSTPSVFLPLLNDVQLTIHSLATTLATLNAPSFGDWFLSALTSAPLRAAGTASESSASAVTVATRLAQTFPSIFAGPASELDESPFNDKAALFAAAAQPVVGPWVDLQELSLCPSPAVTALFGEFQLLNPPASGLSDLSAAEVRRLRRETSAIRDQLVTQVRAVESRLELTFLLNRLAVQPPYHQLPRIAYKSTHF